MLTCIALAAIGFARQGGELGAGMYPTASLQMNFLRPLHRGAEAHYLARPLHAGRSSGVAETRTVGDDGRVAMVARLTAYR